VVDAHLRAAVTASMIEDTRTTVTSKWRSNLFVELIDQSVYSINITGIERYVFQYSRNGYW
jgi:hypothetical protein